MSLISKQWLRVVRNFSKLYLQFHSVMNDERASIMLGSKYLDNIQELIIDGDGFDLLSEGEVFYDCIGMMKNLKHLSIASCCPGENLVKALQNSSAKGSQMESLNFLNISRNINEEGLILISRLKNLEKLEMVECFLGDFGVEIISKMTELKSLDISCNNFTLEGSRALSKLPKLTELVVQSTIVDAASISNLNQLTSLNVAFCNLQDEGAKFICQLEKLTNLNIRYNMISDAGAEMIGNKLNKLETLVIQGNTISGKGALHLIQKLNNLTTLDLTDNQISEKDEELIKSTKPLSLMVSFY